LFEVAFNREVGEDGALYWTHEYGLLARLLEDADAMSPEEIKCLGDKAKDRIDTFYSWKYITNKYEELFTQ
jgi:rhamnosyltransferase